jgi:hypothetical protein
MICIIVVHEVESERGAAETLEHIDRVLYEYHRVVEERHQ